MKQRFILLFCFFSFFAFSNNVQWASKVLAYSSQQSEQFYAAKQVLGVPNSMDGYTDSPFSWATATENSDKMEFIHVGFEEAMFVEQFVIVESVNPGSIDQVFLYDAEGNEYLVFQTVRSRPIYTHSRFFTRKIDRTPYKAVSLKLTLNTKVVPGINQIDAISIANNQEKIKLKVNDIKYSSIVPYPEDLGDLVNSDADERLPIISPDGKTLYFTRKQHKENIGKEKNDDIWFSKLQKDGTWGEAQNIDVPLNNERHNFVVAVGQGGDLIYVQNAYKNWGKDGIAFAKSADDAWEKPEAMKIKDMYNMSTFANYHVSPDGQVLMMAIEREDAVGDLDLYVSFRTNIDEWSKPKNLGKTVNSLGMESSVFLASDYKTIYFASSGHYGYGGLDIFMSKRLDDSWEHWTEPQNLGAYLNTPGNDFNYSVPASGTYAYFSSDFRGRGQSDLYRIDLPKEAQPEAVTMITGRLYNTITKEFIDDKTYQLVIPKDKLPTIDGFVYFPEKENEIEELDGINESKSKSENKNTTTESVYEEIEGDILLIPLKKDAIIPLQNILFDANKASLKTSSNTALTRLMNFLKANPNLIVEISGHTNGLCDDSFADELSQNRADAVAAFLIQNGIPQSQIQTKGYGKTKPITTNETTDGRRKNQRVELKVLEVIN
jgi:outer membrane protein OmpA-like peptidoglycan-associated protein